MLPLRQGDAHILERLMVLCLHLDLRRDGLGNGADQQLRRRRQSSGVDARRSRPSSRLNTSAPGQWPRSPAQGLEMRCHSPGTYRGDLGGSHGCGARRCTGVAALRSRWAGAAECVARGRVLEMSGRSEPPEAALQLCGGTACSGTARCGAAEQVPVQGAARRAVRSGGDEDGGRDGAERAGSRARRIAGRGASLRPVRSSAASAARRRPASPSIAPAQRPPPRVIRPRVRQHAAPCSARSRSSPSAYAC
jgi:hypothetical protein